MDTGLDSFYLNQSEPNQSCLLALRAFILKQDPQISETVKYGMPCFLYDWKRFCYLWTDKKTDEPYILMVEGKFINHPLLEAGNRSRMKILRINPSIDLPIHTIESILKEGLQLYKTGVIKV